MKTSINDLTTDQLNTLAAMGQGWKQHGPYYWKDKAGNTVCDGTSYDPCHNWSQAGELVERYRFSVVAQQGKQFAAFPAGEDGGMDIMNAIFLTYLGDTPTRAITLAAVAYMYGSEVDYEGIVGGESRG